MINQLKLYWEELATEWDEFWWSYSAERKEMAKLRLAAHVKAMKEGRLGPYTDPDRYDINWEPI